MESREVGINCLQSPAYYVDDAVLDVKPICDDKWSVSFLCCPADHISLLNDQDTRFLTECRRDDQPVLVKIEQAERR